MRKPLIAAVVILTALIAACATLGHAGFKQPIVGFKDVRVNGLGLSGGSLDVVLNVYNPNGFRLDATKLTYNLLVDTIPLGSGTYDSQFTVQSNDSAQVHLPLTFTWAGVGYAVQQAMNTGTVPYRVRGDLIVGSPVGNFTIPYDRTGTFNTLSGVNH